MSKTNQERDEKLKEILDIIETNITVKYDQETHKVADVILEEELKIQAISQINQLFSGGKEYGICSNRKSNRYCKLSNKFCSPKDEENCEGFKSPKDKTSILMNKCKHNFYPPKEFIHYICKDCGYQMVKGVDGGTSFSDSDHIVDANKTIGKDKEVEDSITILKIRMNTQVLTCKEANALQTLIEWVERKR